MGIIAKIDVQDHDPSKALGDFFRSVLSAEGIDAVLLPQRLPMKPIVMPMLVTNPERLDLADLLAPAFPMNGAKLVSRLTRKPIAGTLAVFLRPCEIRAFIELVKLNQGSMENLIIIGRDCPGAFSNRDCAALIKKYPEDLTRRFCEWHRDGTAEDFEGVELSAACRVCEYPAPDGADIAIGLFGMDTQNELLVLGQTPRGEKLLEAIGLKGSDSERMGEDRGKAILELTKKRIENRDRMFVQTHEETDNPEKLARYLSGCVNCYNCRVACPVCYCRECVFVTDVFDHDPSRYLSWAKRKGLIKMPTDTMFYHMTRLAHMSTACVGCGQCSNACPNDIPVVELFRTVAYQVQKGFNYTPGKDLSEKPPLTQFKEKEFPEVVGI